MKILSEPLVTQKIWKKILGRLYFHGTVDSAMGRLSLSWDGWLSWDGCTFMGRLFLNRAKINVSFVSVCFNKMCMVLIIKMTENSTF